MTSTGLDWETAKTVGAMVALAMSPVVGYVTKLALGAVQKSDLAKVVEEIREQRREDQARFVQHYADFREHSAEEESQFRDLSEQIAEIAVDTGEIKGYLEAMKERK